MPLVRGGRPGGKPDLGARDRNDHGLSRPLHPIQYFLHSAALVGAEDASRSVVAGASQELLVADVP
jgi:hypothetical protein